MRVLPGMLLLSVMLLLAACAQVPAEPTPTATAAATLTATPTPSPTATATATLQPTPIGSGGYPLLAVMVQKPSGIKLQVIELATEKLIYEAPLPVGGHPWNSVRFSPDGTKLLYSLGYGNVLIYDFITKKLEEIQISTQVNSPHLIDRIEWSPSGKYLSLWAVNGQDRIWLYDLETGQARFLSSGYWARWHPDEDILMYQNMAGKRVLFNAETGQERLAPWLGLKQHFIESHDVNFSGMGCSICYVPELGNVQEMYGISRQTQEYFYHLIDIETKTEAAFVARFSPPADTEYEVDVINLLSIPSRGDYLVFATERIGSYQEGRRTHFTAWNDDGSLPLELSGDSDANKLFNVMPIALSPDQTSFLGYTFEAEWPYKFTSVVIVDVSTRAILYEYRLRDSLAAVWPGSPWVFVSAPINIDAFWPDK